MPMENTPGGTYTPPPPPPPTGSGTPAGGDLVYPTNPPQGYPAPQQGYPTQGYPAQPQPQGYPAPQAQTAATTPVVPPPPKAAPAPLPAEKEQPPAATRWAAPGASADAIDPESPWS